MTIAEPQARSPKQETEISVSERRCIVTGQVYPREDLIRFVISPDGMVFPDLAASLPGRGMWVSNSRTALATAIRKNLFSKAAKTPVKADQGLIAMVESQLRQKALDYMGLARRAGLVISGQPQVEGALRGHKLALLIVASDASEQFKGTDVPICAILDRETLGALFDRDQQVYIGLLPHALTHHLAAALARLEKFCDDNTSSGQSKLDDTQLGNVERDE